MNDSTGTPLGPLLEARVSELRPGLAVLGLPACVIDSSRYYRYVNPEFVAHFGVDEAYYLGRTIEQANTPPPDPGDARRSFMEQAMAGELVVFNRRTLMGPNAGQWVRAHYIPLRADAAVIGVLVVLVDIQQLMDTEQALADRERKLSLVTDAIGMPITYIDRAGVIRFANGPSLDWAGRSAESMIGETFANIVPKATLEFVQPYLVRAYAGERVSYEREATTEAGEKRRVRGTIIPDRDADGEVRGILVLVMDIEEDHRLREDLLDQKKRLQLVVDNIGVPMAYLDRDMRVRFANQPGLDWQVEDTATALGRPVSEVFDAATWARIRPEIEAALAGEKRVYERVATTRGGDRRWVRVHLIPDLVEGGAVRGIYTLMLDVEEDHRMREALEQKEARLRHFAENIPGPIAVIDRDFRYAFANKVFLRLRGEEAHAIIGRHAREVLGEAGARDYFEPFVERLRRGETCTYERLVGPPGGEARWHLVTLAPMFDAHGEFDGYYIVGSDIHDIKLGEERLRAKEAQLRLYTDNIPDAVVYLDRDRVMRFANRHFAEQRNLTQAQIIGRTTREVMGEATAAWIAERTQGVLDRGEEVTYERLVTLPSGEQRWMHVKVVPDFDGAGGVRGMYVVSHDIHEVKVAQAQLAAREEELRFFAENIPEAIVYVDLEHGCTFVNNVFLATRGFSREYALGKFPQDVYPPEVMEELAPHIETARRGEETAYERLLRLPNGQQRWVRVRLTPRRDPAGRVLGFYVVSTDIHQLKVAQAAIEDKERQLRQVIDSVPTPMCFVDAETRYRYVNDAFLAYVGRPAPEVVGHAVREVLGEERWALMEPIDARVRSGETLAVERLVRFADGRQRWMVVRLSPRFVDGRYLGYYATTSDIHEQKAVEEELRRTNSILSAHFDNTPLAVIEWDTDMRVVRWSGQAERIFGWPASEVLGRPLSGWRLVYEDDRNAVDNMVGRLVAGPERHATILNRNYRKDGSVIWVEWHNSTLRDASGRAISILSLAQDVSSRIQAEERLQYMATHDGLTGLPNSVLLNDRLEAALARARRARRRVGVMFLDLDHFKDVNDTLGHRVGDELLKELSRRIRAALRQSDVLARISGDEFVVVLEDLPEDEGPERVARKILDEARRPFHVEGHEIHVSGSLGLAMYPDDGDDTDTLLKNADAAMYHAKEVGRDGFRPFSAELGERRLHRMHVETALRRALRENELALHFQPIIDIGTNNVRGVEALLRWHDPQRGLVLPQGFIPLAEESGLGQAVGHWVLEAACRQARAWRDAGLGDITVSVNLSAGQLRDSAMVADLRKILSDTGCEPRWLQFEITETSMVRDVEGASVILARLRGLGVRIAIDDFGTGFSSLSHLRHLPVDVLKIDKAFVADIDAQGLKAGEPAGGAAIVSAVIGLARGLRLDVVAEGVERRAQLEFLAREGCGACQGYLVCPPLPAADFERWLRQRGEPPAGKPRRKPGRRRVSPAS